MEKYKQKALYVCLHPVYLWLVETQMRKKLIRFGCVFLSSANKCLLKVGAYCAQLEQYQKAIEIYEQVLLDFFLKTHLLGFFLQFFLLYNWREFVSRLEPTRWTTHC